MAAKTPSTTLVPVQPVFTSAGTGPWSSPARAARSSPSRLAPRTARALDLAIGERTGGPLFLAGDRRRPPAVNLFAGNDIGVLVPDAHA